MNTTVAPRLWLWNVRDKKSPHYTPHKSNLCGCFFAGIFYEISSSTYDALMAKKPLCESVPTVRHMKTVWSNRKIPVHRNWRPRKRHCVKLHWTSCAPQINMIWDNVRLNLKSVCRQPVAAVMIFRDVPAWLQWTQQIRANLHHARSKITRFKVWQQI